MKRILILTYTILLMLLTCLTLQAADVKVDTFFTDKDIERVNKGEIITRMYLKNNASKENTDLSLYVPSTKYAPEDFNIYEMITDEKAFIPYDLSENGAKLKFFNAMTSFSKLKGMQYYSRLRSRAEDLVLDCFQIISTKKKKRRDDITYSRIEPHVTNYLQQQDNKFGKLIFRSDLYNDGNNFVMVNTCLQPISKLMFTMSKKEEYKVISYFIYDETKKGFYFYSVYVMRIRLAFTLTKNDILTLYPTTFSNRLRGATVHLAKILGLNWSDKLNPWDEELMGQGYYKNY